MSGRILTLLLLLAGAARAEKTWVFEPGQALVAIEAGPQRAGVSAVSLGLSGSMRELENGSIQADLRLSVASFTTGNASRDLRARQGSNAAQHPEIVFAGTGSPNDGKLRLHGTLTLLGQQRPLDIPLALVSAGSSKYAHG